jgi:hypothetical protein
MGAKFADRAFESVNRAHHCLVKWRVSVLVCFKNIAARRGLRRCASQDPRFARDIGLTPDELAMICTGPPWKAVTRPR